MGILLEQSTMPPGETRPASNADVIPLLAVVQPALHRGRHRPVLGTQQEEWAANKISKKGDYKSALFILTSNAFERKDLILDATF